jgi:multiple antibiotic resistance protein
VDAAHAVSVALNLFLVVDPVGCIPVYAAIAAHRSLAERREAVRRAVAIALGVLVFFALAGSWILQSLGIGLPAVRIAGGILLFGIGLEMLYGRVSRTETTDPEEAEAAGKPDISVTPLAIPLLAGPGSIAAVILLAGAEPTWGGIGLVIGCLALVLAAAWALLAGTEVLLRVLGRIGIRVIARVMGLLLLFLSTQTVIDGLAALGLLAAA